MPAGLRLRARPDRRETIRSLKRSRGSRSASGGCRGSSSSRASRPTGTRSLCWRSVSTVSP
eukprot:8138770-Alexandrium_andersonii.AAC.1